jgi:hypothetical protein
MYFNILQYIYFLIIFSLKLRDNLIHKMIGLSFSSSQRFGNKNLERDPAKRFTFEQMVGKQKDSVTIHKKLHLEFYVAVHVDKI